MTKIPLLVCCNMSTQVKLLTDDGKWWQIVVRKAWRKTTILATAYKLIDQRGGQSAFTFNIRAVDEKAP